MRYTTQKWSKKYHLPDSMENTKQKGGIIKKCQNSSKMISCKVAALGNKLPLKLLDKFLDMFFSFIMLPGPT